MKSKIFNITEKIKFIYVSRIADKCLLEFQKQRRV